jgi:hypothetical protein
MITYGTGTYAGVLTVITGDITAVPSASANAAAVRTELATELGRIDVATSTRLDTTNYTVPPTANENATAVSALFPAVPSPSQNATAVRNELATELARIDVATSTRLATEGYTAPANADITAIKAKTDNLPAQPASRGEVSVVNDGVKNASLLIPHTTDL